MEPFCRVTTAMHQVPLATTGKLYVMPHPDPKHLDQVLEEFRRSAIRTVVSLLDERDIAELGLEREDARCTALGLSFVHFPIPDYGLPQPGPFASLVRSLARNLVAGQSIVIHCRAGIGRTGMLACCILKQLGATADEAIARVSEARDSSVPDTPEQRRFIVAFT